jgi:hypothetical protein
MISLLLLGASYIDVQIFVIEVPSDTHLTKVIVAFFSKFAIECLNPFMASQIFLMAPAPAYKSRASITKP